MLSWFVLATVTILASEGYYNCVLTVHMVLLGLVGLDLTAVALVIPLLPHIATKEFGWSASEYGLLGTTYGAMQIIGSIYVGYLSDRLGRKPILLLSCVGAGMSYLMLYAAPNSMLLIASRIPIGLLKQTMVVAYATLSDAYRDSSPAERTSAIGRLNAASSFGFIIGPYLGGRIADWSGNLRLPVLVAVALFVLDGAMIAAFYQSTPVAPQLTLKRSASSKKLQSFQSLFSSMYKYPSLWGTLISKLVHQVYRSTVSVYNVRVLNLGPSESGLLLSVRGVVHVVVQSMLLPLLLKYLPFDTSSLAVLMSALSVASFVCVTVLSTFEAYMILVLCISGLLAMLDTFATSVFTRSVPADEVGGLLGVAGALESLSRVLAPMIAGYLMDTIHATSPFLFGALLSVVLGVWHFQFERSRKLHAE